MIPRKRTILAGLLSAGITAGLLYSARQKQESEAQSLRYDNARIKFQAYQNLHPHAEASHPTKTERPDKTQSADLVPQSTPDYRNEGLSTPQSSLQTFVWACDQGDTENVAKMLFFEREDRERAEAFFAALPENIRTKWRSVDEMAATLLIMRSMARSFPAADILRATPMEINGINRASCRVPYQVEFEKTKEGWKFVISARTLELLERELSASFGANTGA